MDVNTNAKDLTKAMLRLPWAISIFGLRQVAHLPTARGWHEAQTSIDAVSHAAGTQMGKTLGGFYKTLDQLQSGMVDAGFGLIEGSWSDPRAMMNEAWGAIDRSWSSVREGRPEGDL